MVELSCSFFIVPFLLFLFYCVPFLLWVKKNHRGHAERTGPVQTDINLTVMTVMKELYSNVMTDNEILFSVNKKDI